MSTEPVAWKVWPRMGGSIKFQLKKPLPTDYVEFEPLYAAPPEKEIESLTQQLLEEKLRCDEYMEDNKRFATQYNKVVEALSAYAGNLEKQIVMLRDTLFSIRDGSVGLYGDDLINCNKALADLDGLILCEKEPVAAAILSRHSITYRPPVEFDYGVTLRRSIPATGKPLPLYRTKEQEK